MTQDTREVFTDSLNLEKGDTVGYSLSFQTLKKIDEKLRVQKLSSINEAFERLTGLLLKFPENPELLWRIGEAHCKLALAAENKKIRKQNIDKGVAACERALAFDLQVADAHLWYAKLIGLRTSFAPFLQKAKDGVLFKKHLDIATCLDPDNAMVQEFKGVFAFEAANMKWYEAKVSALIFDDPPRGTLEEALGHFIKAEALGITERKDNMLYIAKCQIGLGKHEEAVISLRQADYFDDSLDAKVNHEITALLLKYGDK